ncbi:hypothetical protein SCOR_34030 [Sulfidibacter corallicola]
MRVDRGVGWCRANRHLEGRGTWVQVGMGLVRGVTLRWDEGRRSSVAGSHRTVTGSRRHDTRRHEVSGMGPRHPITVAACRKAMSYRLMTRPLGRDRTTLLGEERAPLPPPLPCTTPLTSSETFFDSSETSAASTATDAASSETGFVVSAMIHLDSDWFLFGTMGVGGFTCRETGLFNRFGAQFRRRGSGLLRKYRFQRPGRLMEANTTVSTRRCGRESCGYDRRNGM